MDPIRLPDRVLPAPTLREGPPPALLRRMIGALGLLDRPVG